MRYIVTEIPETDEYEVLDTSHFEPQTCFIGTKEDAEHEAQTLNKFPDVSATGRDSD